MLDEKEAKIFFILIIIAALFIVAFDADAATYYVRTDGGTASVCNGTADADTSATPNCAFEHPAWAIGTDGGGAAAMGEGDTLIVKEGEYMMGYGMPNAPNCTIAYGGTTICTMKELPDNANLYGEGYDGDCSSFSDVKAHFWGTQNMYQVLELGSGNTVECIEVTDHSACLYNGQGGGATEGSYPVQCNRSSAPFGTFAMRGIAIYFKSDITLKDVYVHGLGIYGIEAHGLSGDFVLDNVWLIANGWSGLIMYDDWTADSIIRNSQIHWAGCGEKYPLVDNTLEDTTNIHHCAGQQQGIISSDGIEWDGMATTREWGTMLIENSEVSHNTSDGIDYLHSPGDTSTITIRRTRVEGNAGNPIKTAGVSQKIENSVIIGNCGYFAGQSFSATADQNGNALGFADTCRGTGSAFASTLHPNKELLVYGNTILSSGGHIFLISGDYCDGSTTLDVDNNIVVGTYYYNTYPDTTTWVYYDGTCTTTPDADYSIIDMERGTEPAGTNNTYADPELIGTYTYNYNSIEFDATITVDSTDAIDKADEGVAQTAVDYTGADRGASWDIGAYEYGGTPPDPADCNDDCDLCDGKTACDASTKPCNWWSDESCNAAAETCADRCNTTVCGNEATCVAASCYWWTDDTCNTTDQVCDESCTNCGTQVQCEAVGDTESPCIAGWNLNDNTSSAVVADVCGSYTGTLRDGNSDTVNTSVVSDTGKVNEAFTLDGSTNSYHVDLGETLDFHNTDAFSLEAWIKKPQNVVEQSIVSRVGTAVRGWDFKAENGQLHFFMFYDYGLGDYFFVQSTGEDIDDNAWHHVVANYNGNGASSGVTLYVDGTEVAGYNNSGTLSNDPYGGDGVVAIGTRKKDDNTLEREFEGTIDMVRIYGRELLPSEVTTQYNAGNGTETVLNTATPCYWWSAACHTESEPPPSDPTPASTSVVVSGGGISGGGFP